MTENEYCLECIFNGTDGPEDYARLGNVCDWWETAKKGEDLSECQVKEKKVLVNGS